MTLTRRKLISTGLTASAGLAALHALRGHAAAHGDEQHPAPPQPTQPLRVQIALFDGFEVTDALAPFDVFKLAGKLGGSIDTALVSVNGAAKVTALDDVILQPTAAFDPNADVLVVPGAPSLWRGGDLPAGLSEAMQAFRQPGKLLASVCTGGVLVARAGHFKGRNATTHKSALQELQAQGATLVAARVVDDGDLLSSGGVTSGIDLALYLVERFFSPALALQVEQVIEYERRGTVWRA